MSERWSSKGKIEHSKVDAFMSDIIAVCKKHGLTISHEDHHGAFEIEIATDERLDWLKNAQIGKSVI